MQVLEDLYLGDVHPSERSFKRSSQYARALHEVVEANDALNETLDDEQSELFEELHDSPTRGQCTDRLRNLYIRLPPRRKDYD